MSDIHNSQHQMNIDHQIGSISEGGLIRDLDKRGFSKFQCLCELFANSIQIPHVIQSLLVSLNQK